MTQKYLELDSGTVVYEQRGQGPHPLVLIHGAPGRPQDFNALVKGQQFKERFTTYQIALPGYGYTAKSSCAGASIVALGELVLACIDQLNLSQFSILGHSLGGSIAVYVAQQRPRQCRGLILLAAVGKTAHSGLRIGRTAFLLDVPVLGYFLGLLLRPIFILLGYPRKLSVESIQQALQQTRYFSITEHVQYLQNWKNHHSAAARTAIIYGRKDQVIPCSIQDELNEFLQPKHTLFVQDAAHNPQKECTDLVLQLLLRMFPDTHSTMNK